MHCACRIQEIDELNAFYEQKATRSCLSYSNSLLLFFFIQNLFSCLPSCLNQSLPSKNSQQHPILATISPSQVCLSKTLSHANNVLALCIFHFGLSVYLQCQQASPAPSLPRMPQDEGKPQPLKRCKMSHSAGGRTHSCKRKSLFVELADAEAILDQPPPDNSTKALLSFKMGDATVNGDMPSSSFLSVSSTPCLERLRQS
jgi:hypothetical protein